MKTDGICARYAPKRVGLSLKMINDEEAKKTVAVLIEGSSEALKMLAELLLAVGEESENEGFGISPFGAGSIHFSPSSELGLYIHRIDT